MRSRTKKVRKLKPPLLNVARTMGKWRPSDDYLLIQSVLMLENMEEVHRLTKFSKDFTQKELEDRWFAILYDAPISKMIYKNLKKLHYDDIIRLKKLAPFSRAEDSLILGLDSTVNTETANEFFENFLQKNRVHFHESRTGKSLLKRFNRFKKLNLLKDQLENRIDTEDTESSRVDARSLVCNFEDIEKTHDNEPHEINSNSLEIQDISRKDKEMKESYDVILNEIKRAEADLFLWQALVDRVTGFSNPFVEPNTLAVLFSEHFTYSMIKREIKIGRSEEADIDLSSFEAVVDKKISRLQCKIATLDTNRFVLMNMGKIPVYVDGKILLSMSKTQLVDKSIIEIGSHSILFLVNYNNLSLVNLNTIDFLN